MKNCETINPRNRNINQLKDLITQRSSLSEGEILLLQRDKRKGVQELLSNYLRLRERDAAKKARLRMMSRREKELQARGYTLVAGIDEVGRGPLAGPVVAAAVILDWQKGSLWDELDDSKKLTAQTRERLFALLADEAMSIAVGIVDHAIIDHMNIYQASLQAMRLAVRQLYPQPHYLLCDGFPIPGIDLPQEGIKGGDACCLSIAAASIVAKVIRDQIMNGFDALYPGYGFARHKGYPTGLHHETLRLLGPSPLHRCSFKWGIETVPKSTVKS